MKASHNRRNQEGMIDNIVTSDIGKKYNIRNRIEDLHEIPYDTFRSLQDALREGKARVYLAPMSIDGTTFDLVATSGQRIKMNIGYILVVLSALSVFIFGFFYTWYSLLLLPLCALAFPFSRTVRKMLIWIIIWAVAGFSFPVPHPESLLAASPLLLASLGGFLVRYNYERAVFGAACNKEYAFAYLFSAGKINLLLPNGEFAYSQMEA